MELNRLVFVALMMMMMVISTVNGFGGKKPTEAPCSRSYECATGLCVGYVNEGVFLVKTKSGFLPIKRIYSTNTYS